MKFKNELGNAVKLFLLLSILLWSFTWNSNSGSDFSRSHFQSERKASNFPPDTIRDRSTLVNGQSFRIESFSKARYEPKMSSKVVTSTDAIIPSFNEWREMEKIKYEKTSTKTSIVQHPKKNSQRKLNYASSKCGAKVLASNPEARHRISILNEKPDEYMLNPCRVRTWFVIELCDTVEATQIELANYELYSSSPRVFSVHWSEVYPTTDWHLLGTFEAKDQRTMQTFNINMKNLGKFIKVIIYNHHGKEHYCLMSVIRIIGYSMVEKFEGIDETEEENHQPDKPFEPNFGRNVTAEKEQNFKRNFLENNESFIGSAKRPSANLCSLYFMHCKYMQSKNDEKSCPNVPVCRFFLEVFRNLSSNRDNFSCFSKIFSDIFNVSYETKENKNLTSHFFLSKVKLKDDVKVTISTNESVLSKVSNVTHSSEIKNVATNVYELDVNLKLNAVKENSSVDDEDNKDNKQNTRTVYGDFSVPDVTKSKEKCVCEKNRNGKMSKEMNSKGMPKYDLEQNLPDFEMSVDSAGLIQKESVLIKLTTRIKTSEIDLDLINKYLQQLSQSYRQQMQDMQNIFNQTVKAINAASEVSMIIDKNQQESINALQQKVVMVTRKVDYLMSGQRDMLKRVVEMHAFFLILEIIIISTIFTIFVNVFQRKYTCQSSRSIAL